MDNPPNKTAPRPAGDKNSRRRHRPRPAPFQMRVSTKYAPRRPVNGKPMSCTTETSLKPEQLLELYRYLKLTRLVEERIVELFCQTKMGGVGFRSVGRGGTAGVD